ncbi:hypothetical protein [Myroides odoratus]|uniref:hypothetical protein n=1 Tax=Myroides odoratus TaxID=256 RepID=UPI0039AF44C1
MGNIINSALSEMGTVLETIIIDAKLGADKLSSDWEKNKEKSGYNHFMRNGSNNRFGFMKIYGNGTENGGFSNRSIMNNQTIDANDAGFMGGAGGGLISGVSILGKFFSGVQDVMDAFSLGGTAGDALESWFGGDKVRKHTFTGYKVKNPNSAYVYRPTPLSFELIEVQKDTFLPESRIKSTDWNNFKNVDSLNRSKEAKMWNNLYNIK